MQITIMKNKTKLKLIAASSLSIMLVVASAFALFSDSDSDNITGIAGTVDTELKHLTLSNNKNINPGDEDPSKPEDSRHGTEHKLEFDVENLGNKSVVTRTIISISTESGLNPYVFKLYLSDEPTKEAVKKYYSNDGINYYNNYSETTKYVHYIIEDAFNGVGNAAEVENNIEKSKTHYKYNFSLDSNASNIYQGENININVELQAIQYRNTNDDSWNTVFKDSISIIPHIYENGFCIDCLDIDYSSFKEPGLYDDNLNLLSSYDDLNFNVESKYTNVNPGYKSSFDGGVLVIPEGIESIGDYAFYKSKLHAVILPNSLKKIGISSFAESDIKVLDTRNVEFIDIGACEYSKSIQSVFTSAKTIGIDAFRGCTLLSNLKLKYGTSEVCNYSFFGCNNLKTLNLPNSLKIIGSSSFSQCGFDEIIIPSSIERIESSAFSNCKQLKKFAMISTDVYIGSSLLSGCSNLKEAVFANGIKKLTSETIGNSRTSGMFNNCTSLEIVVLPDSVEELGPSTFKKCKSLKSIKLPENLIYIPQSLFEDCSSLEEVYIPYGVKEIRAKAFYGNKSLNELFIPSSVTSIKCSPNTNIINPSMSPFYLANDNLKIKCEVSEKLEGYEDYWNCIRKGVELETEFGCER